jgi:hypothetical protein
MKTTDLFKNNRAAKKINESLAKTFGRKLNLESFDLPQLEDARNKLRTQIHTARTESGFNETLENEAYTEAQWMLDAINSEIAEREEFVADAHTAELEEVFSDEEAQAQRDATKDRVWDAKGKENTKRHERNLAASKRRAAQRAANKSVGEGFDEPYQGETETVWIGDDGEEVDGVLYYTATMDPESGKIDVNLTGGDVTGYNASARVDDAMIDYLINDPDYYREYMQDALEDAKEQFAKRDQDTQEAAPPGAKAERMVKHIKKGYAKDGKLTDREKGIAYATAWKQHNKNESIEGDNMATLREGEIQQAQSIVTAKTMVDRVGRWIEELSGMENDTLLQLGDQIRDEQGQEAAKGFISSVAPAIQQALENLKATRESLASGVRTLTGEEQSAAMLGAEPEAAPVDDFGGAAEPDAMNAEVPMGDEVPADDFAAAEPAAGGMGDAGRMKRESVDFGNSLLKVLAG